METKEKLLKADRITYNTEDDSLFADGEYVGGADIMTREFMLEIVDESWHDGDDEILFDLIVEPYE